LPVKNLRNRQVFSSGRRYTTLEIVRSVAFKKCLAFGLELVVKTSLMRPSHELVYFAVSISPGLLSDQCLDDSHCQSDERWTMLLMALV
jgi:hypothetical protein